MAPRRGTGFEPDGRATSPQARFDALLARHRGIVYEVANTFCRDEEDVRDLAQEITAQTWRAFPSFDDSRSFSTWMYRIALNVAISQRAQRQAAGPPRIAGR